MAHHSSEYDPLWNALKSAPLIKGVKSVSIAANRLLHPRIIKAVKKRKWLDVGYKLEIEPRIATLSHARNGSKLTFFLTLSITSEDI
jgi:hypothetical protein